MIPIRATIQRGLEVTRTAGLFPVIVYSALALSLLGPGLLPGYLLHVDLVFTPRMDATAELYGLNSSAWASLPYRLVLNGLTEVLPSWVVQKGILFLILMLAGLGAHKLLPFGGVGSYYAGLLYMVNPFTHIRFLAGQWTFLAAYSILPFAVRAFLDMLERGGTRSIITVALLSTLVGVFQIHGILLLFIIFSILVLAHLVRAQSKWQVAVTVAKRASLCLGLFILLNLYWLVPTLSGVDSRLSTIGTEAMQLFAPVSSSGLGVISEVGSMYGFWNSKSLLPQSANPIWYVPFLFILYLSVLGLTSGYRARNSGYVPIAFGLLALSGLILALGASTEISGWLFQLFWDHVPFFRGFQDSHKFVALLALAYAYLGGLGVWSFMNFARSITANWLVWARRSVIVAVAAVLLGLPIIYSFPMFGLSGQLHPTDYPEEWYQARKFLADDPVDSNVLFLPWHQYMRYSWLPNRQKLLSNPARLFFEKPAIVADNLEAGSIYTQSADPVSQYVEFLLDHRSDIDNFGEVIAPINVKYVFLFHEADYQNYDFLENQADLEVVLSNPRLTVFRNTHTLSRVYGVDRVNHISDLQEYLELSRSQEVMEHIYVIGPGLNEGQTGGIRPIEGYENNPSSIRLQASTSKYAVLTNRQGTNPDGWEYEGQSASIKNLGIAPVFVINGGGGTIKYAPFYQKQLWVELLSLLAFATVLMYYGRALKPRAKLSGFKCWVRGWVSPLTNRR